MITASEQRSTKALKYYIKAADSGNAAAQYRTGYMFEHGIGTDINMDKAFEYYQNAVDSGKTDAMYSLAQMYERGIGTDADIDKAIELYEKASKKGNMRAEIRLEILHKSKTDSCR